MRELTFVRTGQLGWRDRSAPTLADFEPGDLVVVPRAVAHGARCRCEHELTAKWSTLIMQGPDKTAPLDIA